MQHSWRFSVSLFFQLGIFLSCQIISCLAEASPSGLQWELSTLKAEAAHGVETLSLEFSFSNPTSGSIKITAIEAHCGCVQVAHPELPWIIEPGTAQSLPVDLNLRGKQGRFYQEIMVAAGSEQHSLAVDIMIEDPVHRPMSPQERADNKQQAMKDPKAIFKGQCAACHLVPTQGKYGPSLYDAACGICHDSEKRDPDVPDIKAKIKQADRSYWRDWITEGKEGTLMPGFSKKQGGPLSDSQISTLLHYLAAPAAK